MSASTSNTNVILLAGLGLGAFWLLTRRGNAPMTVRPANAAQPSTAQKVNAFSNLLGTAGRLFGIGGAAATQPGAGRIFNDDTAGQPGYGWQYFTDGTAISPTGTYYHQGQPVWSPDGAVYNPPGNVSTWDAQYRELTGL